MTESRQSRLSSLLSGITGALALTGIHELARRTLPDAPRMDLLGMRAIRRFVPGFEHEAPRSSRLRRWALAGDIVGNALYYSAVSGGTSASTWNRAAMFGVGAGAGALLLPGPMGLGGPPRGSSAANQWMTVAWYVGGALVAGAVANALRSRASQ
jgi:hypothetical protein